MIGVYKIIFPNTDKVYIGKSINLQKRFIDHKSCLKAGTHTKKLIEAYKLYGEPTFQVIEECDTEFLLETELFYINKYNAVENGFNYNTSNTGGGVSIGEHNGRSLYKNKDIINAFILISTSNMSLKYVANISEVAYDTIKKIATGAQYKWLKEVDPKMYAEMILNSTNRIKLGNSALGRGIVYPTILSPDNIEYNVTNCTDFSNIHNLQVSNLVQVLNRNRNSHKGWRLK